MGFELTTSGSWLQCSDNWAKSTFSCQPESSWPIKSCSIDSRNEQSPTCEVVHETNKAHFRNLLPNRFQLSSIGRALEWWSRGCEFKVHWWQFLTKFILSCVTLDLSDNLTETLNVKNSIYNIKGQKSTSWFVRSDRNSYREKVECVPIRMTNWKLSFIRR